MIDSVQMLTFSSMEVEVKSTSENEERFKHSHHIMNNNIEKPSKNAKCKLAAKCVSICAAYGRVCPCAARAAASAACKAVQELNVGSDIFPQGKSNLPEWICDDLAIGKKLGQGGFSQVHQVTRNAGPRSTIYAIKFLMRDVMVNKRHFELGAADLAAEAHFLNALSHDHIVQLHAVTAGSVESNIASGKECGFFIIIDRLYDTLEERIKKWKDEAAQTEHKFWFIQKISQEFKEKRRSTLGERLKFALDICSAMQYLHGLKIVFRDLKPDNVGFDKHGVVKLFDFGLAKELKRSFKKQSNGAYKLTGQTGSRRYMAPEVALELPYDLSVDLYSFGILLWEICAMEKPFLGYSADKHQKQVVCGDERPRLDTYATSWWPVSLRWLLNKCWSPYIQERPNFELVTECLNEILISSPEVDYNGPFAVDAHPERSSLT